MVLGMAKRFFACLGAAGDHHLLANPKSPGSAVGICLSMLGKWGWHSQWDGGAGMKVTG